MSTRLSHVLVIYPGESVRSELRQLLSQTRIVPAQMRVATLAVDALMAYQAHFEQCSRVVIFALCLLRNLLDEGANEWLTEAQGSGYE